ncbi:Zn-ribbon domain-containing OB-fold protein [Mycobacterium saskatchewanense]|uniref:Zn-ribbon domain-containing OB-fold protein n=1 Tax=Mycobacterium saskatchewanense TaxID=220927 RepID=UPI001153EB6C|nr:zinc ribbon domain-containing protein [Mycobacterium saskatchewanense]
MPGSWNFDYRYFAGETASRFFAELRDNQRIVGRRCPACRRLLIPARSYCDACYVETAEWEEVAPVGTLDAFAIVTTQFPGLPAPPLAIGFVTLDGADSAILNFIEGVDLSDVEAAGRRLFEHTRVAAKFSDARTGRITDFHFVMQ